MAERAITVGVDFAASAKRTAACRLTWDAEVVLVHDVRVGLDDEAFLSLLEGLPPGGRLGLDCPLGWPAAFVAALRTHAERAPWPGRGSADRTDLLWRASDRWVGRRMGRWPLSVSTDRIGVVALRAAYLLDAWEGSGARVDRSGVTGPVVEVYPAAARSIWGLSAARSLDELEARLPLRFPDPALRQVVDTNEHVFDAVVAALVARAAALSRTEQPPPELESLAAGEGWIHLPSCSIEDLVDG